MKKDKYTLVGVDGNAYAIMAYVVNALKREGKTGENVDNYLKDAKSSDYNHLIAVSYATIESLNKEINNKKH